MKTLKFIISGLLVAVIAAGSAFSQQMDELEVGSKAPLIDKKMEDVSGDKISLQDATQKNGLVVIFSCNTCPWVDRWEDRYPMISEITRENEVGMIAINSNEAYRKKGDSMDDMKKRASKMNYDFAYALDRNHEIADAFGATRTPHVYLFNGDMELVYVGAIDDNAKDANAVDSFYLKKAIEQMVLGKKVETPNTKSLGCTIKRVSD